jgi:hypothetical protein
VERRLFQTGTVRPGPVGKRDLGVDQLLNVVLAFAVARAAGVPVIVVVVVPAPGPVSVIGRERAVRCPDVGEREDGLAACFVRGGPQQRYPAAVNSTLNAVAASPRSVPGSRSRADIRMALALPHPGYRLTFRATVMSPPDILRPIPERADGSGDAIGLASRGLPGGWRATHRCHPAA